MSYKLLSCLILAGLSAQAQAAEKKLYVGSNATEVILKFNASVDFDAYRTPTEDDARSAINSQVAFLFGPMSEGTYKAVPKGNQKIMNLKIARAATGASAAYRATYSYEGTAVVENGAASPLIVYLPRNPVQVWEQSYSGSKNTCLTDSHYEVEKYFWYFWNPVMPGCILKENQEYLKIGANYTRKPNTASTYPEYDRLVQSQAGMKVIPIHLLMGMDDPSKDWDPNRSTDINADNFRQIKAGLKQMGFTSRVFSASEVNAAVDRVSSSGRVPYIEEFVKATDGATPLAAKIVVRIFFGASDSHAGAAFRHYLKNSFWDASVVMYAGHSGLGAYLNIEEIEETEGFDIAFHKDAYQIYFFNGCSTYPYYNEMYFKPRMNAQDPNGTKNLDILTNGLSTYFYVMPQTNLALIKAVTYWSAGKGAVSYQALARQIDSGNLFGVNGDEDNPTTAPAVVR